MGFALTCVVLSFVLLAAHFSRHDLSLLAPLCLAIPLLLLVGSVSYFGLTDSQGHRGGVAQLDGYYYYIYLRSLQVDGDLDFENEYAISPCS